MRFLTKKVTRLRQRQTLYLTLFAKICAELDSQGLAYVHNWKWQGVQSHAVDILPLLSQTDLLLPEFPGLLSGLSGLRVTQRKQHLEFPRGRAGCMKLRHPQYKTAGWKSCTFCTIRRKVRIKHMTIKESYRNIHIQLQGKYICTELSKL